MTEATKTFFIGIEGGCELPVTDIWPDGDAPADPTVEDVISTIQKYAPVTRWLRDWNMDETVTVTVEGQVALNG